MPIDFGGSIDFFFIEFASPMYVYYCDHFELPLPSGHRFPINKYQLARERVASKFSDHIVLRVADAATRDQLIRVHSSDYVDRVFEGQLTELEQKRIGFPWSPKMLERSRRSVGATIAASHKAIQDGVAAHLSGGTHHAFADEGQGYCVFNDVAVAALELISQGHGRRGVVIDLDVHQGNGTAAIFQGDRRLLTFSMHGDRNYPFRKTEGDLDVALPDGTTDNEYLALLESHLESLELNQFDFAFYIAGADPHEEDRLGRLKISQKGLRERDQIVLQALKSAAVPTTIVMGGGYGEESRIAEIHAATIGVALEIHEQVGSNG